MISLYEPLKKVGNLGLGLAFAANGWDGVAWDARQVRQAHAAAANCYLPVGGLVIVSIVVPFIGLTIFMMRMQKGNPKKELQWRRYFVQKLRCYFVVGSGARVKSWKNGSYKWNHPHPKP